MITMPDRIGDLIKQVEGGATKEQINAELRKIATLQPLDLINAGRQFAEQALKYQEEEYDRAITLSSES